jgi:hypothetical protein
MGGDRFNRVDMPTGDFTMPNLAIKQMSPVIALGSHFACHQVGVMTFIFNVYVSKV